MPDRRNIKLPGPLFNAIRDDKPDSVTWPNYLESRCLTERETDNIAENVQVDTNALAAEVARRIDYSQLAGQVAEELEGRMR
jgi:hypothetical protein